MKLSRIIGGSVAGGIVVTLASTLVNTTPSGLVGGVWYGWPLPWIVRRVLAPQYNPWFTNYGNLLLDIVFVAVFLFGIMYMLKMGMER